MYAWAIAFSIVLSVLLSAYLFTIVFANVFEVSTIRANDPIDLLLNKIRGFRRSTLRSFSTTHFTIAVSHAFSILSCLLDIPSIILMVLSTLFVNRKIYVFAGLLFFSGYWVMNNNVVLLGTFDDIYRCGISPFINNVLFTVLHVLNVFWGALIPVYNIFVVVIRQAIFGSFFILTKCTSSTLTVVSFVEAMVEVIKTSILETLRFFGFLGGISATNNFIVNTMRVEKIIEPVRRLLQFIPEAFGCLCSGNGGWLELFYDFIAYPLFIDEFDYTISHFFNFLISWMQVLLQCLPPFLSYPTFEKPFFHLVSMGWELARLFDKWSVKFLELIFQIFRVGGYTIVVEVPTVFAFGTVGRLFAFSALTVEKGLNITQHLVLPFDEKPITDTSYMLSVFSFAKPIAALDSFLVALFNSVHFVLTTIVKLFVMITAMNPSTGCKKYPNSCHMYLDGSCAVYCSGKTTIKFLDTPFSCPYEVNSEGRYLFNLETIETLDRKVFQALDSFQDGIVTLPNTRACLLEWDHSYSYRRGDAVNYEGNAYYCNAPRCFYTTLQQVYPNTQCGELVSCWSKIPFGDDAIDACPAPIETNSTVETLAQCNDLCNSTSACKAYEYFDLDKYKTDRENVDRQCSTDTSLYNYMKCDFPRCQLYSEGLENTITYVTKNRRPTVRPRDPLSLVFVYTREGESLKSDTTFAYCKKDMSNLAQENDPFCIPSLGGLAVDKTDQFETYTGVKDPYRTFAYKTDLFTTEQDVFLPLQREILSVSVKKDILSQYTFSFSRRDPKNQTRLLAEPLMGENVKENDFKLGKVRDTYKNIILPDNNFNVNRFISCTGLSISRATIHLGGIYYEMMMEILWKIIIGTAINPNMVYSLNKRLWDIIYSFDGGWFSRDEEPPCSPPLPLDATRMTFDEYNGGWEGIGFHHDPFCGDKPTLQANVLFEWDRAFFYATSILQRDTFGKLAFNGLRLFTEAFRITVRTVMDMQSGRVMGILATKPFGCTFDYGDQTGDCTPVADLPCAIGFPSKDCQCRADDPDLEINTVCGCIWLPSQILDTDLRQTTNAAVTHWCGVNNFEWLAIIFSRISDAVRKIIDSLQVSSAKGFPRTPDMCLIDERDEYTRGGHHYTIFKESIVDRVFGGVIVKTFSSNLQYSCPVEGKHDFACSLGSLVESVLDGILAIARKLWRNAVSSFSFQFDAVDIDLSSEICHLSKVESALSSTIVELAPGFSQQSKTTRKGITALLYSFLDIFGVVISEVHTALLFVRAFLSGNPALLEGGATGSETAANLLSGNAISAIFYGGLTKSIVVVTTFIKQLFEALSLVGAKGLFLQLRDIVGFIEQLITGGIIPIVSQMLYLGVRLLGLLFAPHLITGKMIGEIVTQILELLANVVTMLLSQAMKVLAIILNMMGAFGKLIGSLLGLICKIQGVLSDITFGAWAKMDCSGLPSLRRRTLAEKEVLRMVYDEFEWGGSSFCDKFITYYKDYKLEDLRGIELLRFEECVEWRMLGEQVRNISGLKALPYDLFYNWKVKYTLLGRSTMATFVYFKWYFSDGRSMSVLKNNLDATGLPADDVLETIHIVKKLFTNSVTRQNGHTMMMNIFREHDPSFQDKNSSTGTAKAYRIYNDVSTSVFGIYDIVSSEKFRHNVRELDHFDIPSPGSIPFRVPTTSDVFAPGAVSVVQDLGGVQDTFGRIYTNLDCQQSDEAEIFCFQCAFFDNWIYSWFDVLQNVADFYESHFVEDFVVYFNNTWTTTSTYNQKYAKSFKKAQNNKEESYGGTTTGDEWWDYITGLFLHRNRTLGEFGNAVSYFFQGNHTGDIPEDATLLFPGDYQTILEAPFQQDCTSATFLWKEGGQSPGYGLIPWVAMTILFELFLFFVSDVPLILKLGVHMAIMIIGFFSYLIILYEYNPLCVPAIPTYFVRDIIQALDEFFVDCACTWFPFLSANCQQMTCFTCDSESKPEYVSCLENASGMEELGVFWHYAFLTRWLFPAFFAFVGNLQIFPFTYITEIDGIDILFDQSNRREIVNGLDIDCFWLTSFLPVGQILALVFVTMAITPVLQLVSYLVQLVCQLLFHIILSTIYLAYAASVD